MIARFLPSHDLVRSFIWGVCIAAASVSRAVAEDENQLLPLPAWTEQDMSLLHEAPEAIPLGGYLWPDGFNPDSVLPPETSPTRRPPDGLLDDDASGPLSSKRTEGFLLFIPKPRPLTPRKPTAQNPQHSLVEVKADFLRECEELEPDGCLLDPHSLLAETASEDLRRLLSFHSGEASTTANFLLLDLDEQLPASADLSRIGRGKLVQNHACLTVYPLAEPWRARIFMTREITTGVPTAYLRGILQACARDAMRASDPVEQLQRFATQLSIRLIWMERAYPHLFTVPDEAAKTEPESAPVLSEVRRDPVPVAEPNSPFYARWQSAAIITGCSLVGLLAIVLICRVILRWQRRRMRNSVWLLPEVEAKPRFGGPHCGQGGVWIRYG